MKLLLAFVLLGCAATFARAQNANSYKEKATKKVYEKLVRTVGLSKASAPALVFTYTDIENCNQPCRSRDHSTCPSCNAVYNSNKKTIFFGEAMYDIAADMDGDSLAALAFALGHELAHFQLRHDWGLPMGMYENVELANTFADQLNDPNQIQKMEAQADFLGMLYAYLAGYSAQGIGARYFAAYQKATGWKDKFSDKYPSFSERCQLTKDAEKALEKFIPIFDAANVLLACRQYQPAQQCFKRISKDFASREILNNLGTAAVLYAMDLLDNDLKRYAYPFISDNQTRLASRNLGLGLEHKNRANAKAAELADDIEAVPAAPTADEKIDLLRFGSECFENAIHADPDYLPAHINLALSFSLLRDEASALEQADKAIRLARQQKDAFAEANANIAKGIAHAWLGETDNARKAFTAARSKNKFFADLNLDYLAGKPNTTNAKINKIGGKHQDKVDDHAKAQLAEHFPADRLEAARRKEDDLISHFPIPKDDDRFSRNIDLYTVNLPNATASCIVWQPQFNGPTRHFAFVMTKNLDPDTKYKGIQLGTTLLDVARLLGEPSRTYASAQGLVLAYDDPSGAILIIQLNADSAVSGWTIGADITSLL